MHIHLFLTYDQAATSWGAVLKYQRCRCGETRVRERVLPFKVLVSTGDIRVRKTNESRREGGCKRPSQYIGSASGALFLEVTARPNY